MQMNRKGEMLFPIRHGWMTADEIDTYNAQTNAPLEYAPSKGMTEIEAFQAAMWTSALDNEAYWA
jgi:hypothetical protein